MIYQFLVVRAAVTDAASVAYFITTIEAIVIKISNDKPQPGGMDVGGMGGMGGIGNMGGICDFL